jgi:hypothetical protein
VEAHVGSCRPCRGELARYCTPEGMIDSLRHAPLADDDAILAPRGSRRASPICARAYRVVGSRGRLAGFSMLWATSLACALGCGARRGRA